MTLTGNRELDLVIRHHEARQEERARRWAVVRWAPVVEYYETEEKARDVLARMPVGQRAGLVDRQTGDTWARKQYFNSVMAALRRAKTAPKRFRRKGALGVLEPKHKRRKGPYRKP